MKYLEKLQGIIGVSSLSFYWIHKYSSFFFFFFFGLFRASPMACGGSQARGLIEDVAAGLTHSHGNARSKLHP